MKNLILLFALIASYSGMSQGLDSMTYNMEGQAFNLYYAMPAKLTNKTKTILIVHEWWGLNDYVKSRALKLAGEGHIAVCVDMYGAGKTADNPKDALALASPFYQDPKMAYRRFMVAYTMALNISGVDKSRMAAIGYCFGGTMVLTSAAMGAPLDAVVSFHGGLADIPVNQGKLTAAVLVCHGAADSFVPEKDVTELKKQMAANGEDFTFISYANATHAFTNPNATEVGKRHNLPIAYNASADKKSWKDFTKFLKKKVN